MVYNPFDPYLYASLGDRVRGKVKTEYRPSRRREATGKNKEHTKRNQFAESVKNEV